MVMAASPKLSIIIPTYQAVAYLAVCLESIRAQTFENYEILVMDGGSTDGTIPLAMKYHVHLFAEKDKGIYDAMNKGISKAQGEWLFFLGADDRLAHPKVLETIFSNPLKPGLIYGNVWLEKSQTTYGEAFDFELLASKNISHQAIFYHKSVFKKLGLYDISFKYLADWDFNLKCFGGKRKIKTHYLPETIAHFSEAGTSNHQSTEEEFKRIFKGKHHLILTYGGWNLKWTKIYKPWLAGLFKK